MRARQPIINQNLGRSKDHSGTHYNNQMPNERLRRPTHRWHRNRNAVLTEDMGRYRQHIDLSRDELSNRIHLHRGGNQPSGKQTARFTHRPDMPDGRMEMRHNRSTHRRALLWEKYRLESRLCHLSRKLHRINNALDQGRMNRHGFHHQQHIVS